MATGNNELLKSSSEPIELTVENMVKPTTERNTSQLYAGKVIAYEKMISLRNKEIRALRCNASLLQEKISLMEKAGKNNSDSCSMREVELDFMHKENDQIRQKAALSAGLDTLKNENAVIREQMATECKDLEMRLVCEKGKNTSLSNKLKDATLVSERTMLAYETQKDLLHAKEEIIDNLKKEIESITQLQKSETAANHDSDGVTMTSNSISVSVDMVPRSKMVELTEFYDAKIKLMEEKMEAGNAEVEETNRKLSTGNVSIKESCEFIQVHAKNGVIMNPFLLWLDIQRKMHPEDVWKANAVKSFVKTEITEAKDLLWRLAGEEHIGKQIRRQGSGKATSEVNDICEAVKKLAEKDKLPMFLCTSSMVARTPIYGSDCPVCDHGNINDHLNKVNEGIDMVINTMKVNFDSIKEKVENCDKTSGDTSVSSSGIDTPLGGTVAITDITEEESYSDGGGFQEVMRNKRIGKSLVGNKGKQNLSSNIDTELVVHGLPISTSKEELIRILAENNVHVKNCSLLTRHDNPKSFAYKIRVANAESKCALGLDIWPERAGIRPYTQQYQRKSTLKRVTLADEDKQTFQTQYGKGRQGNEIDQANSLQPNFFNNFTMSPSMRSDIPEQRWSDIVQRTNDMSMIMPYAPGAQDIGRFQQGSNMNSPQTMRLNRMGAPVFGNVQNQQGFGNAQHQQSFGNAQYQQGFGNAQHHQGVGNGQYQQGPGNAQYQQELRNVQHQNGFGNAQHQQVFGNVQHQHGLDKLAIKQNLSANTVRQPSNTERQIRFVDRIGANQFIQH